MKQLIPCKNYVVAIILESIVHPSRIGGTILFLTAKKEGRGLSTRMDGINEQLDFHFYFNFTPKFLL